MVPQEKKLLDILSNNDVTFFIPPYQRNYEWTHEQCKVFLEDVKKTYEQNVLGKTSEHFFGTITYFQAESIFGQPDKLVLIDGQQRITTTMLFLAALRDLIPDQNMRDFIDSKYLKNSNVSGDSEYKIKLKQVETDWDVYKKIVLSESVTPEEKKSPVYENYRYFVAELAGLVVKGDDLSCLISKGLQKFSVITIELQPMMHAWENPQEIFESMNSLGKPLSLADLVRNYLMLGLDAETQDKFYKKYWLGIEKTVPKQLSKYIRDFMQCYERKAFPTASENNYKDLYREFKDAFKDCDTEELLKTLKDYSEIYKYLMPGASTGNLEIDRLLNDLKELNITTAYSFLMALLYEWHLGNFTDKDIYELIDAFRIYCIRKRLLGLAVAENKNFPLLTNKIPLLKDAPDKREAMFEILASQQNALRVPNDIELARHMETMNFYNFKNCELILCLTEEKLSRNYPDRANKRLQVEHIMPQTLSKAWKEELGPDADAIHLEYVNTIGNLTLIHYNPEVGNKPFSIKKPVYDNQEGMQISRKMITSNDGWDAETIKARTDWIIQFILEKVLPIPTKMRRANNFSQDGQRHLSFVDLKIVGEDIYFYEDPTVIAHVTGDKTVEFEGKQWKLSPLTREIQKRRGSLNKSGTYSGSWFWKYQGMKLYDLMQEEGD